jgi:hypothetical protein
MANLLAGGRGLEGNLKAESFQAADQITSEALRVETVEIACAEIMVRPAIFKHVVDDPLQKLNEQLPSLERVGDLERRLVL